MSLEDKLDALTKALERNSDILEKGIAKAGAAKAAPAAATTATTAKPATNKPATSKPTAPKVPTEADIREKFGAYLSVKDKAQKEANKANVRSILAHFGVNLASEIPEESRSEALGYVAQLQAGETPSFMNEDDSGAGEEESLV